MAGHVVNPSTKFEEVTADTAFAAIAHAPFHVTCAWGQIVFIYLKPLTRISLRVTDIKKSDAIKAAEKAYVIGCRITHILRKKS